MFSVKFSFQGGIFLLELLNEYCGGIPNVIVSLFMCVGLAWIYRVRHFCADIQLMIGRPVSVWWKAMWCIVSPLSVMVCLPSFDIVQWTL